MGHSSKCSMCKSEFGMFLWHYNCSQCKAAVCSDCAPEKKHPQTGKTCRLCERCLTGTPSAATQPVRNEDEERAKRVAAMEMRRQKEQHRGKLSTEATARQEKEAERAHMRQEQVSAAPTETVPTPSITSPSTADSPQSGTKPNPALEAALKRQQGGAQGSRQSPEQQQLLRSIDSILAAHGETAPFGLRSSDAGKLRTYLAYLKEKYKC